MGVLGADLLLAYLEGARKELAGAVGVSLAVAQDRQAMEPARARLAAIAPDSLSAAFSARVCGMARRRSLV